MFSPEQVARYTVNQPITADRKLFAVSQWALELQLALLKAHEKIAELTAAIEFYQRSSKEKS